MSSTRRSGGGAAAAAAALPSPTKATRSTRAAAAASAAPVSESKEAAGGGRSAKGSRGRGPAAADAFDFDAEEKTAQEEEEEEEEVEHKGSSSGKKKGAAAVRASPRKSAAPAAAAAGAVPRKAVAAAAPASPRSKRAGRGGRAAERKATDEEEEDADVEAEEAAAAAAAAAELDAEYSTPLQRRARSASVAGAGALGVSKEEAEKLLDATALKTAMATKEELLKRLKKLAVVLAGYPQQESMTPRLRALAAALIDRQIVKNKSAEVRAIAACCIADLFRIFAPEAPFTDDQLRVVFDLILHLLGNLSQPTHSDFAKYFCLLEQMVTLQFATCLCNRSNECDAIIQQLFALFFALAAHDLSSSVLSHFVVIMGDVAHQCEPQLPRAVLDEVLRQLTPDVQTNNPNATALAVQLLNKFQHAFERPVLAFLHETLTGKKSRAGEDEEDESGTAITDRVDHLSILSQLHQHCPQLALGFQKQSVTLLEVGDEGEREEYTDLFGQVFTSPSLSSHRPDTVAHFSQLFAMLLNRFHDVSAKIRVRIAQHAGNLLIAHGQIESQKEIIQSLIQEALLDREEAVRQSVIDSIKVAGLADADLLTPEIIEKVGARCLDKKTNVSHSALRCLAELFDAHCGRYWRVGQGAPSTMYRVIPKKLIVAAKLGTHTAVTVDVLLDEVVLGADVSVEQRTRCLLGIYMALINKKPKAKRVQPVEGEDAEDAARAAAAAAAAAVADENDTNEARMCFKERLLGLKVQMHKLVNHLLDLHTKLSHSAKAGALGETALAALQREKHMQLGLLAQHLMFEHDSTPEEVASSLQVMFFESKDKNIIKYLRALANPLTQYEQIRIAQSHLVSAVKGMAAHTASKAKKGASLPKLAQRLAATMSMAILPMESIDVVYREMRDTGARREPLFKSCQELLLLIASTFPKLMTHPQTTAALFEHISIGLERENEVIVTNTLLILREIKDPTAMQADKKLADEWLAQLKSLSLEHAADLAPLAVDCIQNLWGTPKPLSSAVRDADAMDEDAAESKEEQADVVLAELLKLHCAHNLLLSSPLLDTALACAARIAHVNYPLFLAHVDERRKLLSFCLKDLFPTVDIVQHASARKAALTLVQNFLVGHGRSGAAIDAPLNHAPGSPKKVSAADTSLMPRNWLIILLKILKLDGRMPDLSSNKTTREQLVEVAKAEESEEEQQARLDFLVHTSYALLELCCVPVFHRFFVHTPIMHNAAAEAAAAAKATGGSLLSPKAPIAAAAAASHPVRHMFQFIPLAFLAQHDAEHVSKAFMERVMQLLTAGRLSLTLYAAVLVLGCKHPDTAFVKRMQHQLALQTRQVRRLAVAIQRRAESKQETKQAEDEEARQAAKPKAKRKSRKSGADAEEIEGDVVAHSNVHGKRMANQMFPEYVLADVIYLLSYDPKFVDQVSGPKPSSEEVDRVFETYDRQLSFIDWFLDVMLHDPPEMHGGNFSLLFSVLERVRSSEDVRDHTSTKVYKLGELALHSLKHRSGTKRWNDVVYEAMPTLSQLFWRPRSTPHLKDKYLPTHYRPNVQAAASGTAAAAAAAEPGTPKRKRKAEGESTPGGSARRARRVTEEDEEGESSPPKKARTSSAKKQPRKVKEEATPTRSRLSRGAKADVKYDDNAPSDVDMSDMEDAVLVRRPRAPVSDEEGEEEEEEEQASSEEEEEEEADVDMTSSSKRRSAATTAAAAASPSKSKSKAKTAASKSKSKSKALDSFDFPEADDEGDGQSEEEEEEEEQRSPKKRGRPSGKAAAPSSGKKGSAKKQTAAAKNQPGIRAFMNGK